MPVVPVALDVALLVVSPQRLLALVLAKDGLVVLLVDLDVLDQGFDVLLVHGVDVVHHQPLGHLVDAPPVLLDLVLLVGGDAPGLALLVQVELLLLDDVEAEVVVLPGLVLGLLRLLSFFGRLL